MADSENTEGTESTDETQDASKKVAKKVAAGSAESVSAGPQPAWDDGDSRSGVLDYVIQVGPVLLLLVLMLILDTESPADAAAASPPSSATSVEQAAPSPETLAGSDLIIGSVQWPGAFSTAVVEPAGNVTDPGAFYWGPFIVEEAPPAPGSD